MKLTRRYRFSASHRLHAPSLSGDDNARIYGKCNNPFGHGHDYMLEVVVRGPLNAGTGLVVDLRGLDDLVRREVIDAFDHRNLNADVPAFGEVVPTSENLAVEAGRRLRSAWQKRFGDAPALEKIRIHETRRNIFELSL
jgi:6-pyruvoyltetrahydropterin/6-carboxytetrahydropterin synthase